MEKLKRLVVRAWGAAGMGRRGHTYYLLLLRVGRAWGAAGTHTTYYYFGSGGHVAPRAHILLTTTSGRAVSNR